MPSHMLRKLDYQHCSPGCTLNMPTMSTAGPPRGDELKVRVRLSIPGLHLLQSAFVSYEHSHGISARATHDFLEEQCVHISSIVSSLLVKSLASQGTNYEARLALS